MTIYGLIASTLWTASAVLFVERFSRFANRWLDHRVKTNAPPEPVPDDISAFAMLESEKWAQDDKMKVIRERYEELKDWNKVRVAIGVAQA